MSYLNRKAIINYNFQRNLIALTSSIPRLLLSHLLLIQLPIDNHQLLIRVLFSISTSCSCLPQVPTIMVTSFSFLCNLICTESLSKCTPLFHPLILQNRSPSFTKSSFYSFLLTLLPPWERVQLIELQTVETRK